MATLCPALSCEEDAKPWKKRFVFGGDGGQIKYSSSWWFGRAGVMELHRLIFVLASTLAEYTSLGFGHFIYNLKKF
jgi:hypothetical protein